MSSFSVASYGTTTGGRSLSTVGFGATRGSPPPPARRGGPPPLKVKTSAQILSGVAAAKSRAKSPPQQTSTALSRISPRLQTSRLSVSPPPASAMRRRSSANSTSAWKTPAPQLSSRNCGQPNSSNVMSQSSRSVLMAPSPAATDQCGGSVLTTVGGCGGPPPPPSRESSTLIQHQLHHGGSVGTMLTGAPGGASALVAQKVNVVPAAPATLPPQRAPGTGAEDSTVNSTTADAGVHNKRPFVPPQTPQQIQQCRSDPSANSAKQFVQSAPRPSPISTSSSPTDSAGGASGAPARVCLLVGASCSQGGGETSARSATAGGETARTVKTIASSRGGAPDSPQETAPVTSVFQVSKSPGFHSAKLPVPLFVASGAPAPMSARTMMSVPTPPSSDWGGSSFRSQAPMMGSFENRFAPSSVGLLSNPRSAAGYGSFPPKVVLGFGNTGVRAPPTPQLLMRGGAAALGPGSTGSTTKVVVQSAVRGGGGGMNATAAGGGGGVLSKTQTRCEVEDPNCAILEGQHDGGRLSTSYVKVEPNQSPLHGDGEA